MRISPPAPRPLAQLRSWVSRCGATCPDSAVEPPSQLRRRPQARAPADARSLQHLVSPALCARASQPGFEAPSGERKRQAGRAGAPAPAGRASPTQLRTRTLRRALTRLDSSAASALPRGSMALPDPPGPPPRRTAPPRKWTPAAGLCQPGPPPARGAGRGRPRRRSARPSAGAQGRPGARRAENQASGAPRRDPRGTHDGPARPQTPPSGHRPPPPPSPGKTHLRTCGRTTYLGVYSHYQNKAWISGRVPGFQTQIPGSIQTLHIRERQDSEKSQVQF